MMWRGCDADGVTRIEFHEAEVRRYQKLRILPPGDRSICAGSLRIAADPEAAAGRDWLDIAKLWER